MYSAAAERLAQSNGTRTALLIVGPRADLSEGEECMPTVIGLFEQSRNANDLVDELQKEGFAKSQIGLVARHEVFKEHGMDVSTGTSVGAITGATTGGIAGLLIGFGTLAIPVIGGIVAAGELLTVIGATVLGMAGGALAGGLIGSLSALGLEEARARTYSEAVTAGHIMVTVQTPQERVQEVSELMTRYNAVEIDVVPGPEGAVMLPSAEVAQPAAVTQPPQQPLSH